MHEKGKTVSEREKKTLEFWKKNDIFKKSERRGAKNTLLRLLKGKKKFIFYDGPPFATGLPHFGNILTSIIKDAIPRYQTMRGHQVLRQWGWDCHGLPLEVEMEKSVGTKTKKDIEKYGIEKFNNGIRKTIFTYTDEWKEIIPRIGRWVDMENDYRTMSTSYIESVWSVFNRLHKKGFVSNGFKMLHLCPRCSTVVSNTEVADSYETLNDTAVYVLFQLKEKKDTYLVAWTTTPWTLFGNVALGVREDMEYTVLEKDKKKYIVHSSAVSVINDATKVGTEKGSNLVGKEYIPPFNHLYATDSNKRVQESIWRVQSMQHIEKGVGTGIVHIAPAYGKEDMDLAQQKGLPIRHHVTKDGFFVQQIKGYEGMRPKEAGNPKEVDTKILHDLSSKGLLLHSETIEHRYPVCWRCKTPLLNYATNSWFVHAERYKKKMVSQNKKVKWIPEHIRDGRFGNWLEDAQEWAVSRDRFWGAPLPAWKVEKTGEHIIVNSLNEMVKKMPQRNQYTFIRHGYSKSNEKKVLNCKKEAGDGLTEKGKAQAEKVAEECSSMNPSVIFCSPLTRTRETAAIIAQKTKAKVIEEPLLTEIQIPNMHGKSIRQLHETIRKTGAFKDVNKKIADGEAFADVYRRVLKFFEKTDQEYKDAHIIVVTHRSVVVSAKSIAPTANEFERKYKTTALIPIKNASRHKVDYKHIQRTENGEVDLHRPYTDNIVLYDDEKNPAHHTKEVFDCWFESGAMPYGSKHYPFENKWTFNPKWKRGFPANFISEGLDQTRGWFYSLMAIGVGAFNKSPYQRVVVNGIIRAADGKKMSKSLKNYTDPEKIIERYGADALRHYLLASTVVRGEDLDFKEEQVDEVHKKVYARLHNCLNFYTIYAHLPHREGGENMLDRYIRSRLSQMRNTITKGFEKYHIDEAVESVSPFVEDLSTWYLRRSRDRLKSNTEDGANARETLRFVLTKTAICIAPIAPFYAEYLFTEMKQKHPNRKSFAESVHLTSWPQKMPLNKEVIKEMNTVRDLVSLIHEQRAEAKVKVRQPLARVTVQQEISDEQKEIIKEEVNVKEVVIDTSAKQSATLDTEITSDLRIGGVVRECIRKTQKERKEMGLSPTETFPPLKVVNEAGDQQLQKILQEYEIEVKEKARVDSIVRIESASYEKERQKKNTEYMSKMKKALRSVEKKHKQSKEK